LPSRRATANARSRSRRCAGDGSGPAPTPARASQCPTIGAGSIILIPSVSTSRATPRSTASSLKRAIPASILSARASGAKESFRRAREMPPAIAACDTPAFLNASIIFCSSPTLIHVTWSASESSARSLSSRWATATTVIPRSRAARAASSGKTPLPAMRPSLFTFAANDSALRVAYEIDQPPHLGEVAIFLESFRDRCLAPQLRKEQHADRRLQRRNRFGLEAAPLQSDLVDARQPRALRARHHRVRRHVLRHLCARRHDRLRADAAELMHPDLALANRVLLDHAVARQPRGRRQDHVVADDAVVRDVRVGHYQRVTADFCDHSAAFGAAVDRRELANHVVVADFDDRRFALEFQVLRFRADGGELPDAIALANRGVALDHRARTDHAARPDLHP